MSHTNYKHEYICSTERFWKEDEQEVIWQSNVPYEKGDWFTDSDGLKWHVISVVK